MAKLQDERDLDARLARLETVRSWSPRTVSRLETLLRSGDDEALFRINPLTFASQRGIEEGEAVDLFLHAAALGLFQMDWLLICPRCACAVESFAELRAVKSRFQCPQCRHAYEAALDDLIAVYFNVQPTVCRIVQHTPDQLPPFDYLFGFRSVREGFHASGVAYLDQVRSANRGALRLEPHGQGELVVEAGYGRIFAISADSDTGFMFRVEGEATEEEQRLRFVRDDEGFQPEEASVRPGRVVVEIANRTGRRDAYALLHFGMEDEAGDGLLTFAPYLTGKQLITSQTFRSLFRSEVVGGAHGLAIRDVALLFTDIKGSTVLYQRIGDLNAFELVQQHFDRLRDVTLQHGGAIVKTIGDAVMAAYPDAAHAMAAALAMRDSIAQFNQDQPERPVSLKIGLHHGAAIAVTLNDQLDYFGHTVNIASRVQAMADAAEIWATDEVWRYPGVQALLQPYLTEQRVVRLPGVAQPMAVVRIG